MGKSYTDRIVFIDWLRVISCYMVMIVHSCECVYSNDYSFSFNSDFDRWCICFINGFVRPAVPLFIMASAYLLVPLKMNTFSFFRKRFIRVCIPFLIWLFLYAVIPFLWGEFTIEEVKFNVSRIFVNFVPRESHLWFIYMLLGIYLIMPIISPWLEKVTKKEEEFFLVIWLFTTLFWHAHEKFGEIFGECWWNPYPMFYYVSGYVGFVIMAHYIRNYCDWSFKKTIIISCICFLLGYLYCIYSFITRSFVVDTVKELELSWQTTSIAPVFMSFGTFLLIKKINCTEVKVLKIVRSISKMSYGMYLMHMMILPCIFISLCDILPVWANIFITAFFTYVICYIVSRVIAYLKLGKYIIG